MKPQLGADQEKPLLRKFAIVKLWPHLKTAEDECVARIKSAARLLNLECIEVDSFARLTSSPHTQLTGDDIDFVLHLHYETPKCYDIFSIVALWNPIEFYHMWGYRRHSSHLLTHDDFVSCESPSADAHVGRMIARSPMRVGPQFTLHHSVAEPILPPTTGEQRLFYVGINWERLNNKNGRHAELLRLLDKSKQIRIYGPRVFQGIAVWEGYESYSGPLPFDGTSIIHKIHQAGVCLCLSSDAHKDSELMTSRLFEGLAAGAVIIVDENAFARRHFGETLLYVDTRVETEELYEQILVHLDWIKRNREEATSLARAAQEIFLERFVLTRTLGELYNGLEPRKKELERLYTPHDATGMATICCLIPEFTPEILDRHLSSCKAQRYKKLEIRIFFSEADLRMFGGRIEKLVSESGLPVVIDEAAYYTTTRAGRIPRKLGQVLSELVQRPMNSEYVLIVAPNEQLFSDHLPSLIRTLELNPDSAIAAADALLRHKSTAGDHADLSRAPKRGAIPDRFPIGYARLLFRRRDIPSDLPNVLSALDATCNRLLFSIGAISYSDRCSVTLDIQDSFHVSRMTDFVYHRKEYCYIADYVGDPTDERSIVPDSSPDRTQMVAFLSDGQKLQLAVDIFHLLPLPGLLKRPLVALYRKWLLGHDSNIQRQV